jgi:transposase
MTKLTDEQWTKIYAFLVAYPGIYAQNEAQTRRFVEAVLWLGRTGSQWRELPETRGNWNSVAKRFARWCQKGVWEALLAHFADEADLEYLLLDSTIIRAHPCAAGAPRAETANAETTGGEATAAVRPPATARPQNLVE